MLVLDVNETLIDFESMNPLAHSTCYNVSAGRYLRVDCDRNREGWIQE